MNWGLLIVRSSATPLSLSACINLICRIWKNSLYIPGGRPLLFYGKVYARPRLLNLEALVRFCSCTTFSLWTVPRAHIDIWLPSLEGFDLRAS